LEVRCSHRPPPPPCGTGHTSRKISLPVRFGAFGWLPVLFPVSPFFEIPKMHRNAARIV
jgi:hypothetical protein